MPDHMVATALGEIEARMGIPSIESLLAERDELVQQVAPLRAKHGPFGTYDALRKVELSTIASALRAQAVADGRKMTEASIEEAAHSDSRYVTFVTIATQEKTEWATLENRITGVADTIRRGEAIAYYLSSEARLAR